eukprot:m.216785 g.216785  ORF g.216785 m.216785 type:complete len:128 (+) comp54104_c0_seq28:805-1188(+)
MLRHCMDMQLLRRLLEIPLFRESLTTPDWNGCIPAMCALKGGSVECLEILMAVALTLQQAFLRFSLRLNAADEHTAGGIEAGQACTDVAAIEVSDASAAHTPVTSASFVPALALAGLDEELAQLLAD